MFTYVYKYAYKYTYTHIKHTYKNKKYLNTERAPIDKVAIKEIGVCLTRLAVELKNIAQIVILPVHITADCDMGTLWHWHIHHRIFRLENIAHLHCFEGPRRYQTDIHPLPPSHIKHRRARGGEGL